jgi:selenocysteine lyase/cysteine desulfurase
MGTSGLISRDVAASTAALPAVLSAVEEFVPRYSSVHRGAGYKSQRATGAYEATREAALVFAGGGEDDVAIRTFISALGGTRNPNLLIRIRSTQSVQLRPNSAQ